MRPAERRRALRALLAGSAVVRPASVFDAMSARIAEDMGFETAMLAGSVASMAVLGAPDVTVLTLTELADLVRRISRAGSLPLLVDADHGFGNALSVRRTVEELEAAGAAGLTIEDTLLPRPFGGAGPGLVPLAEGRAKLVAALDARTDPDLLVIGRTSAARLADEAEALARIHAYQETGVDALCLIGVRSRRQLDALSAGVTRPILLAGVRGELDDPAYLAARGVRLCIPAHAPFAASVRAVHDALAAARPAAAWRGDTAPLLRRASREDAYEDWGRRFLGDAGPQTEAAGKSGP
jgi:carboxyvinyl-carboxyphosphonate phosphorylmutase